MNIILLHASNYNYIKTYGPRCLYTVNNITVLDQQIDVLNRSFKNPTILVVGGFKSKKIKHHIKNYKNVILIENTDYEITNDLYSLGLAIQYIENRAVIIQDNILFKSSIFSSFVADQSKLFISQHQQCELGCIIDIDKNINNIAWGLKNYWTNILYIQNYELDLLKEICDNPITKRWFLMEGLNWIIDHGGQFKTVTTNSSIITINKNNVNI